MSEGNESQPRLATTANDGVGHEQRPESYDDTAMRRPPEQSARHVIAAKLFSNPA
jgi:hypothetical protein